MLNDGRNPGMRYGHALVALAMIAAFALPAIALAHDEQPGGDRPAGPEKPATGEKPSTGDKPSCQKQRGRNRGREGARKTERGRCGRPHECSLDTVPSGNTPSEKSVRNGREGQGEPGSNRYNIHGKFAGTVSSVDAEQGVFSVSVKRACPPAANTKYAGKDVSFKLVGKVFKPVKRTRNEGGANPGGLDTLAAGDRVFVKAHSHVESGAIVEPFEAELVVDLGPAAGDTPASGETPHK